MLSLGKLKFYNFYTNFNSCGILAIASQNIPVQISVNGIKTKSLEVRLGIPEKPKKPLTPYFRFMKEIRPTYVQNNPNASLIDIVKLIAKEWETVDSNKKAKFEAEYRKEQIVYIGKRADYDSKLTDEQRNSLKQLKHEIIESKEKKVLKKKIRDLGKPKRPGSAFIKFLIDERTKTPQEKLTYREWHKNVTEKWKQLTVADKDKFIRLTKIELETYKKDLSKWEEKMVRLGNIDVVRHEALIEPPPPKPRRKVQE